METPIPNSTDIRKRVAEDHVPTQMELIQYELMDGVGDSIFLAISQGQYCPPPSFMYRVKQIPGVVKVELNTRINYVITFESEQYRTLFLMRHSCLNTPHQLT